MGISCIKCVLEEKPTQVLRYFKYISPIKLNTKIVFMRFAYTISGYSMADDDPILNAGLVAL